LSSYGASARPLGVQQPRLVHTPARNSSAGQEAVDLARAAGLVLDPWQAWVVGEILGERDEMYFNEVLGVWLPRSSAYESALIVARQNGKGSILEALELAWLYLLGAKTIIHSAHEFATSREHFQRIESLISGCPELKAELARGGIKWSHGDESINLATGQRLLFKTRTKGAARGFSPDKIVMDEAMILNQGAVSAMTYAMSARPDPQLVYAGSAGDKDSEHFGRARSRGINGGKDAERLFLAEWSADICTVFCDKDCTEHDDPRDPATWAKANPALGYRIQHDGIESELARDPEGFLRERLSVGDWPTDGEEWKIIPQDLWKARVDETSEISGQFVLAVDTAPDGSWTCLSAAGLNDRGDIHIEMTGREGYYDYRQGTRWVVDRVIEIWKNRRPLAVVIDKAAQAGTFIDQLAEAKVKLIHPNSAEFAQSCGDFYSAVVPTREHTAFLVHLDQEPLNSALAGADKRDLAGSWAWSKRNSNVDISPLVSVTLASWGFKKLRHEVKASAPWVVRR
jgi:hypothetical protein